MAGLGPRKRTRDQIDRSTQTLLQAHAALYDDWLSSALGEDADATQTESEGFKADEPNALSCPPPFGT